MLKDGLRRVILAVITAALPLNSFAIAFAQQPAAMPPRPGHGQNNPAEQDDVISFNSNLVQVDTVVLDNHGQQVTNLQAADFEIVEDGRVRQPEYCSYVFISGGGNSAASTDDRLSATELRRSTIFIVANPLIELRNNSFNQNNPFALPPTQLLLPTTVTDARAAAKVLTEFVDRQMGLHELAAIRESEGALGPFAGLTTDRSILHAAIERAQTDPLKKAPKIVVTLSGVGIMAQEWVQQNLHVIQMMSDAVDQLGRLPGRRLLVLLSRGMLYGERSISGTEIVSLRMSELIAKANIARVTIYTLNARGPDPANLWGGGLQDNGGMMILARETGGRAIFNTNDLTHGLADVLEENRGYYLLGYNPGQEVVARPHNIQVRVRRPGMRVQARRTAYAPGIGMRGPISRSELADVLTSPLAFRELELNLTPLFLSPDGRSARLTSLLNIDLANVDRETHEDGSQAINLDIVGQVTAPDGRVIYRRARNYSLNIPRAEIEGMLRRGIDYWFDIEANSPGHYQVSVAVRDAHSGRTGNATRLIEVADLSRGSLGASSLLLSRASEEATSTPPAPIGEEGISAYSRREFPAGGTLRYQCYVYNARRNEASRLSNLHTQLTIRRGGVTQATTPVRIISQTDSPVFVGGDITLGTMPTGNYTLELTITDALSQGARTVVSTDFRITS